MDESVIYILGDICPRWGNGAQFDTGDSSQVFHELESLMKHADLVIANLEAPSTTSTHKLPKNSINLKALPEDVILLREAGIRGVSLANNHVLDYGIEGLEDTIKNLDNASIFSYGAGSNGETKKAHFVEIKGLRIGILAFAEQEFNCAVDYGKGANLWNDLDGIISIKKTKEECDYLIVQYHGGIEEYRYPSPILQKKCRAMADAGADLITCQHSHCVGTREMWKGTEILYGQGNCVFGYDASNEVWNQGLIIKIELGRNNKVTYIPIEAKPDGEHLMQEGVGEFLSVFFAESEKIRNSAFVLQEWRNFCKKQEDAYFPMLFSWGRVANKLNRLTGGKLIRLLTKDLSRRNSMNLIRCDAHREVMTTILEMDYFGK